MTPPKEHRLLLSTDDVRDMRELLRNIINHIPRNAVRYVRSEIQRLEDQIDALESQTYDYKPPKPCANCGKTKPGDYLNEHGRCRECEELNQKHRSPKWPPNQRTH